MTGDGPAAAGMRKQVVNDVAELRRGGEVKSYIDLLFLALVVVPCVLCKDRDKLSFTRFSS